jgi:hypothetical protein
MAKRYRLGPADRLVNGLLRGLLAIGIGPPRTYLLITRGRTTGRVYKTPVALVEDPQRRWVVARGRRTETLRPLELGP